MKLSNDEVNSRIATGALANRADATIHEVDQQSSAFRALDAKLRAAAGWDADRCIWSSREPQPLTIRIKTTGVVLTIGFEHARDHVISGVAELIEE
jgi:hypothetical protein